LRNETILSLDIYRNGPYKLIYVIAIVLRLFMLSFICNNNNNNKVIKYDVLSRPPFVYVRLFWSKVLH